MRANETANIKEKVRRLPNGPGVYLMKDRFGRVIYVGKAKSLKKRVSTYFHPSRGFVAQPKIRALVEMIADFDTCEVRSEAEALLLEGKLIKQWKPRYNTDFTDDKRFLLLRVDMAAEIPRFRLARQKKEDGARYFGPFAHAGPLRQTLVELRKRFGILLGDASPARLPDGRWRLYDDVRAELFGFSNEVTPGEYGARVARACAFLEGKTRDWLAEVRRDMEAAAARRDYEKAARLRDLARSLEQTILRTRKFARDPVPGVAGEDSLERLRETLSLPRLPAIIECFDISHISGTFVVASMARFTDGRPDKTQYRRFQIKSFIGNDDFRAMEEVVGRRYRRLAAEGKALPDLVVIDGGKGQITAALRAFLLLEIPPPALIGLAKKEETVLFSDDRPPLRLPSRDPALRLLQRIRDEAHRLANSYNAELRGRLLRESVLDEFPGLGPVRRRALLARFPSMAKMRQATAAELGGVPGIGPKTAEELFRFLQSKPPARAKSPGKHPEEEGQAGP